MEQNIKDFGKITKLMEKVNFCILMEIFFKEIGNKIGQMVMVFTIMQMAPNIKVIGLMIYSKDLVI